MDNLVAAAARIMLHSPKPMLEAFKRSNQWS